MRARLTHRRISCTIVPYPCFTVTELLCANYRLRNIIMKRLSAFKHVPSDEGFQGTAKRQILLIGFMVSMFKCQRVLTLPEPNNNARLISLTIVLVCLPYLLRNLQDMTYNLMHHLENSVALGETSLFPKKELPTTFSYGNISYWP